MAINIVCTSKPCDGLLFYSYEYCSYLNSIDVESRLVIVPHRRFKKEEYLRTISSKYTHCQKIRFDDFSPASSDVTLIMGRSMMTLPYLDFASYRPAQQSTLKSLFSNKVVAVYSENHPVDYLKALEFFAPLRVIDLCDTEVYPNGIGEHFEKRIYFDIYKPPVTDLKFDFLFLGTNKKYYETVQRYIHQYPSHGILTYEEDFVDPKNNNVFVPIENLMGIFKAFVYTKSTFDPAPRIIQECKFFGKELIYSRDLPFADGGKIYWNRSLKEPDVNPILHAVEQLNDMTWTQNHSFTLGVQP